MRKTEVLDRYPGELYDRAHSSPDYIKSVLNPFGNLLRVSSISPKVLDLASGKGEAADYLETSLGIQAVRADLSMDGMRLAKGKRVRALADKLPFPDSSFDGVHMKDAIVHIPDTFKLFQEIARILKPGGKALIVSAYPDKSSSFYYKEEGSTMPHWTRIHSQSDYLRHAEGLMRDKKTTKISPPYYATDQLSMEIDAERVGLNLQSVYEWIPEDNTDWYTDSARPEARFVMLFEKS
ncbi:MAG TPA: class I SAM-dependent methyltransferase [Candidatus Limnocylindrales bacterium]|nr:class I SAM-dependent methyltransferase [Candidatus Limnocylindrales bacterium]